MRKLFTHVTVLEWEQALLLHDGRITRVLDTGRHRYRPSRASIVRVDRRPRLLTVPGQEILTADGVTVRVSVQLTWQVVDSRAFVTGAESAPSVLYAAVQDGVRAAVAAVSLDDALADRTRLSAGLDELVAARVADLGITVTAIAARDLMLPGELRRAAMDLIVTRERGRAELERARAEAATLRSLANTARLLEEHPALLHLRTLQAAGERGAKLVVTPWNGTSAAVAED